MNAGQAFTPGSLRDRVVEVSSQALAAGALLPIPTGFEFVEDGGVRFLVRVLASLARKDEEGRAQRRESAAGKPANPFLPYEPGLFVASVSESHVAILNKFNVVDQHLLIVTRRFEDQRSLLTPRDFEAWWRCLAEYESLGFYNGGPEAGASQPHKHLQVVPLPLAPGGPAVPIAPLLAEADGGAPSGAIPGFDFRHAFTRFDGGKGGMIPARRAYERYGMMLEQVGIRSPSGEGTELQSGPYCLLATRGWMLLVPRSRESFAGIAINSLGYAGALLVRSEEQLRIVREMGPLAVLRETALPRR